MKIRVEGIINNEDFGLILDNKNQNMWIQEDGGWMHEEIPEGYWNIVWNPWQTAFNGHLNALSYWTGGEYTYTDLEGNQISIYDIKINPTLPDSMFEP